VPTNPGWKMRFCRKLTISLPLSAASWNIRIG
jgi:hypothetical protein